MVEKATGNDGIVIKGMPHHINVPGFKPSKESIEALPGIHPLTTLWVAECVRKGLGAAWIMSRR